jgi:threonyl-tRNA synthetase
LKRGENFKVEIIQGLPQGEEITVYQHGDWMDLCKGPHVARTGEIKAFKLLSVAGAYWRGTKTGRGFSEFMERHSSIRKRSTSTSTA